MWLENSEYKYQKKHNQGEKKIIAETYIRLYSV